MRSSPILRRTIAAITAAVLCGGLLAACGSDDDPTVGTSSTAPASKAITLTIADGKVTPELGDVNVAPGQLITLTVTSDKDDEVHAHTGGEGVELELTAGKPGTVDLIAPTIPGAYEVETHESGLLLFQLVVR
jgi:hypothetical protein